MVLNEVHRRTIKSTIRSAFPELHNKRVIVYIGAGRLDTMISTSKVVEEALSQNTKVKRVLLSDVVEEVTKRLIEEVQIHPLFANLITYKLLKDSASDPTSVEPLLNRLSPLIYRWAEDTGIDRRVMVQQIKRNFRAETLRYILVGKVAEIIEDIAESNRDAVVLVDYDSAVNADALKILIDMVVTEPKPIYVFVDNAVYLNSGVVDIIGSGYTLLLAVDSLARLRSLVTGYLHELRRNLQKQLRSPLSWFTALHNRRILEGVAELTDRIIKERLDLAIMQSLLTAVDASIGVLFRAMKMIVIDLYAKAVVERKPVEQAVKAECIWESVRWIAENYDAYTFEDDKEVFGHYLNILEHMTKVDRKLLIKALYVLSLCAQFQIDKALDGPLLISEATLGSYVGRLATSEERTMLSWALPNILEALKRLGFITLIDYGGTRAAVLLRPMLLNKYGAFAEKMDSELRAQKEELLNELEHGFKAASNLEVEPDTYIRVYLDETLTESKPI